jgi:methionyl-tRNA formyltransferase
MYCNQVKFIFASCHPFYDEHFESVSFSYPGQWLAVSSSEELDAALEFHSPAYIFFIHWNWKVGPEILNQYECVCFHMTDVPYGRGGSPLQNLIVTGHEHTVISALRMEEEMDAGPVYAKRPMSLDGRAEEIYARAGSICIDIIQWIIEEEPVPEPQLGEPILFKRRKPSQSEMPVSGSLRTIYDHIRMLDAPSYPLAFVKHGGFRLEFSNAQLLDDEVIASVVIKIRTEKTES